MLKIKNHNQDPLFREKNFPQIYGNPYIFWTFKWFSVNPVCARWKHLSVRLNVNKKFYGKRTSENVLFVRVRIFSVIMYQPVGKYKSGRYLISISCIFYILIYILNSNIEICFAMETIQDIGAVELLFYWTFVHSLHLHTQSWMLFPTMDHFYFLIW